MLSPKASGSNHTSNDQMPSPRKDSKIGSVTSSKHLYHHVVETDGSQETYDIGMKEFAEDVDFNKKQKALFGMSATEIRMSITEEMPFNIFNNGIEEEEEDVTDTAETKERDITYKKLKTDQMKIPMMYGNSSNGGLMARKSSNVAIMPK